MGRFGITRMRWLTTFSLLVMALGATRASAQTEALAYPLPFSVEGSYITADLYIALPGTEYDLPLADFRGQAADGPELALADLLGGVLNRDEALLRRRLAGTGPWSTDQGIQEYIRIFERFYPGVTEWRVLAGLPTTGGKHRFVLEGRGGRVPATNILTFRRYATGDWVLDAEAQPSMIEQLVNTIFLNKVNNGGYEPAALADLQAAQPPYQTYAVPAGLCASTPESACQILFRGVASTAEIFADDTSFANPALELYRDAYAALRDDGPEAFFAYLTPASAAKAREAFAQRSPAEMQQLRTSEASGKWARFVLQAPPVNVVFYNPNAPLAEISAEGFGMEYVIERDGELKLGNLGYSGPIDRLFLDEGLQKQGLAPLIEQAR